MESNMMVNGLKENNMARVFIHGQMEIFIWENSMKVKEVVKEFLNIQMAINMMAFGV